jgi:hypothetical protein
VATATVFRARPGRARGPLPPDMAALLLVPLLRDGWPAWRALVTLAVSAGTHALIDRRRPVRGLLRVVGSPGFATLEWGVIAVDQALQLSILAMLAVALTA